MNGARWSPLVGPAGSRSATAPAGARLRGCTVVAGEGPLQVATGADEEGLLLVLHGTFDFTAGGSHWGQRGARSDPCAGRPLGIFLPPATTLVAEHGNGALLLVRGSRPAASAAPAEGKAALSQRPLLPLAGSGKAFDPAAGLWRPAETFPTAAEILPPRRIERRELAGAVQERVFPADYKALLLSLDEVVLAPGGRLPLAALGLPDGCTELLLVAHGAGTLQHGDAHHALGTEAGACFAPAAAAAAMTLQAGTTPLHVVVAYAGKPGAAPLQPS